MSKRRRFTSSLKDKVALEVIQENRTLSEIACEYGIHANQAVHWMHIRTTNPIESTFATVRLRTERTKGCGSRITTLTMVFQLAREAQKSWRKLRGYVSIVSKSLFERRT